MKQKITLALIFSLLIGNLLKAQTELLVHYKFDETEDTLIHDASGNGFDAFISIDTTKEIWGATGPNGLNGALQFFGTEVVNLPADEIQITSEKGSVSFWIKNWNLNKIQAIFSMAAPNENGELTDGFGKQAWDLHFHLEQPGGPWMGGELCFFSTMTYGDLWSSIHLIADPDQVLGELPHSGESKAIVIDSIWHHVVGTWESGGNMAIYLDGKLMSEGSYNPANVDVTRILLGSMGNPGRQYIGLLDEFRLYNGVLSSEDINALYSLTYEDNYQIDTIYIYDTIITKIHNVKKVTIFDIITVTDTLVIDVAFTNNVSEFITNTITVYPNPSQGIVFIDNGSDYLKMNGCRMKIINTSGKQIFESAIDQQIFELQNSVFGEKGIYIIQILDPENKITEIRKLILN